MKICITGGTGFLGQWVSKLSPKDMDFIVLSRNEKKSKTELIKTDYSDNDLENIFENQNFDAVVHLAGRKIKDEYDLSDYLEANTILADKIFRLSSEYSIENVVTASSRMVYSDKNSIPWKEEDSPKPMTYYGLSKLLSDKLGQFYSNKYEIKCKSLRFAQIFGVDIGRNVIQTKLFRNFINNAREKKPLPVYGNGENEKEYIYVKDATNAIFLALEAPTKYGIFNIGLGENKSILDIAKIVNMVFKNEEYGYQFLQEEKEENENNLLDTSKSKKELDFYAQWNLKKALFDMKDIIENESINVE